MRAVLDCVLLVACCSITAAAKEDATQAVAAARQYLGTWQLQLAAIVAEEHYEQVRSVMARSRSGLSGWHHVDTRKTAADVLLLRVPAQDAWLCFRDVFDVNGEAVRDRQQRFDALFRTPGADVATHALAIANESARYNLGAVTRNVNTPTTALMFLQSPFVETVEWELDARSTLDGTQAWLLKFNQRKAPFAVRTPEGNNVPASGRIWLEPASGRIRQTEIVLRTKTVISRVRTTYGRSAGLDSWVPLRMEDEYTIPDRERVTGNARYVNHRIFQTSGRIIG